MISAKDHTILLETLHKCVSHQRELTGDGKKNNQDNDATMKNAQQLVQSAKDDTKRELFNLLLYISQSSKDELDVLKRETIDDSIHGIVELKWPLLRALEDPSKYRAFLGLPKTMEQTRIYLTQVSTTKIQDIFKNLNNTIESQSLQEQQFGGDEVWKWVEQVLHYMTGDGRRKKELNGYLLKDKGIVRSSINKIAKFRKQKMQQQQTLSSSQQNVHKANDVDANVIMERDVRLEDQQRHQSRTVGMTQMIDEAITKSSPKSHLNRRQN